MSSASAPVPTSSCTDVAIRRLPRAAVSSEGAGAVLELHRTQCVTVGARLSRARRLIFVVPGRIVLPGIENASDPDVIGHHVKRLIMTRMATSKRQALWVPDTELFVHAAAFPWQLRGCAAPGLTSSIHGVQQSATAMERLLDALGGFREGAEVDLAVFDSVR